MPQLRAATLPVMHDGYRLPATAMRELIDHVRAGGRFEPVHVTRFEDGRLMLRDGLHRSTAVMLGRASGMLDEGEALIEDMTYEMFLTPALAAGLFAPFDPRREVRIADFRAYRDEVQGLVDTGGDPLGYIAANRHVYVRPRRACHDSLAQFFAECSPYGSELAA
jgi:hypothetical protein